MAPKRTNIKNGQETEIEEIDLPEGFAPITRESIDGWFVLKAGNTAQGIMLESFMVPDRFKAGGKKKVFKVRLTQGETAVGTAENDEPQMVGEGAIVGIDEKGWLKALESVKPDQEVFIRCLGREKTAKKGQQPAWRFQLAAVPF